MLGNKAYVYNYYCLVYSIFFAYLRVPEIVEHTCHLLYFYSSIYHVFFMQWLQKIFRPLHFLHTLLCCRLHFKFIKFPCHSMQFPIARKLPCNIACINYQIITKM